MHRSRTIQGLGLALALCAWLVAIPRVCAHEIRPAVVTVSFPAAQRVEVRIATNLEALLAGIGPEHKDTDDAPSAGAYNTLRALAPAELERRFREFAPRWLGDIGVAFDKGKAKLELAGVAVPDMAETKLARISTVLIAAEIPAGSAGFQWSYPRRYGSSVLRAPGEAGELVAVGWLKDGETSETVPIRAAKRKGALALFAEYFTLGFTHILPKGLDHILFVLGLYLLSPRLRPLLVQVTAFTIAHSITLALGLYGVVEVSPSIVEPLIALSIVYVAVENLLTSDLTRWRPAIVFAFGLLHGLGFAGVLQEVGLPASDYALGLLSFNLGVEGGQLAVIALAWGLTGVWFMHQPWYRKRVIWPASAIIAAIGLFWTVERIFGA